MSNTAYQMLWRRAGVRLSYRTVIQRYASFTRCAAGVAPTLPACSCIQQLLQDDQNPRAEDIECLCKLLSTVGQQLESPQVKGKAGMSQQQVRMSSY